ncbi:hypothetical protein GWI33_010286 [Rhynchophorus ferrugineus]|uniref:Uncharacterized protein n=1 Tax=Rhynchophorus ferrugineus TaxID=354439 RepID=A0A834IZZ9_RHYFE|nr:hypothetical protein GWI33_011524 [Rhynchophorus ferrugineus]KAF7287517.1 hypothetical protein GWI33_010286 [Rhynchophorus ferrugineus]
MQTDEIEKQAEQMQAAFKKATKLLKTTTIIIKEDNQWWDGECQQKKLKLRRKADSIRREDGAKTDLVREYEVMKRAFKKLIKEKKKKHVEEITENTFDIEPRHRVWKIIKTLGVGRRKIVEKLEDAELGNMYNLEKQKYGAERSVISNKIEFGIEKMCPQRSSIGPTLWLININSWFDKIVDIDTQQIHVRAQGFADEQIIAISH